MVQLFFFFGTTYGTTLFILPWWKAICWWI